MMIQSKRDGLLVRLKLYTHKQDYLPVSQLESMLQHAHCIVSNHIMTRVTQLGPLADTHVSMNGIVGYKQRATE